MTSSITAPKKNSHIPKATLVLTEQQSIFGGIKSPQ